MKSLEMFKLLVVLTQFVDGEPRLSLEHLIQGGWFEYVILNANKTRVEMMVILANSDY